MDPITIAGLAAGAWNAINAGRQQGAANDLDQQAIDLAMREYASREPLRQAFTQGVLRDLPAAPDLTAAYADPSNPFYTGGSRLPEAPASGFIGDPGAVLGPGRYGTDPVTQQQGRTERENDNRYPQDPGTPGAPNYIEDPRTAGPTDQQGPSSQPIRRTTGEGTGTVTAGPPASGQNSGIAGGGNTGSGDRSGSGMGDDNARRGGPTVTVPGGPSETVPNYIDDPRTTTAGPIRGVPAIAPVRAPSPGPFMVSGPNPTAPALPGIDGLPVRAPTATTSPLPQLDAQTLLGRR